MSESCTSPVKVALTGPTFCLTTASYPSATDPVRLSQPGMHSFSTSGFRIASQTTFGSSDSERP